MKRTNHPTIRAKRALCLLALTATTSFMLPACDKEPDTQSATSEPVYRAPYEKELFFDNCDADSIEVPVVKKYADDTACKKIYLTTKPHCDFSYGPDFMINWREQLLEPALAVSPKVTGRGDIYIMDGPNQIYYTDSIWYIQNGWRFRHY